MDRRGYTNPRAARCIAAAVVGVLACLPRAATAQTPPDVTLTKSATSDSTTVHTLTFDALDTEVDFTLLTASSVLTVTGEDINKAGAFNSILSGGLIKSTDGSLVFNVDGSGGTLTVNSPLNNVNSTSPLTLTKTGVGTLILGSTNVKVNNFSGGIVLDAGILQFSSAANLGSSSNVITFNGGSLQTFNAVTLTQNIIFEPNGGTLDVEGKGSLTLGGNNQLLGRSTDISLNKVGTGALVLTGSNAFNASVVNISQGILELQNPLALGGSSGSYSAVALAASATSVIPQLNLHPTFDANGNAAFFNRISITGNSAKEQGIVNIGPASGSTAGFVDMAGGLSISNATLTLNGIGTAEFDNTVTFTGVANFNNAVDVTLNSAFTGSGSFIKSGAGTLSFVGRTSNSYTGPITVAGGTLALDKVGGTALSVPADLTISGGTVRLDQSNQIFDQSTVTLNSGAFNANDQSDSIGELINNGGTFTTGKGTITVTAASTTQFNGGINTVNTGGTLNTIHLTVSGGVNTVQAGGNIIVGAAGLDFLLNASPSIAFNSDLSTPGKLTLGGNVSFSGTDGTAGIFNSGPVPTAGTIDLGATARTFTVADGAAAVDMAIGGTIVNGSLVKDGPGVLQLTAANSYAGGTTLSLGTLQITDPGALGTGPITFNGGTLDLRSDATTTTFNNGLTAAATTSSNLVIGSISAPSAGTFVVPSITIGAALNLNGANGGTLKVSGPITLQANATINNSVDINFAGVVSGAFGFNKTLSGNLTLSGPTANTYTGLTTISGGTLQLSKSAGVNAIAGNLNIAPGGTVKLLASEQINDASSVTLNATGQPAVLNLNDLTETIASISDGGTGGAIQLGSIGTGLLNFGSGNDSQSFAGNITGGGSLAKFGAGTYTFAGNANTFTGGAAVHAGTLGFSASVPGFSSSILSGGSWTVFGGAALAFPGGSSVATNQASITLTGVNPTFSALNALTSNPGSLTLANGAHFASSASLSNDGTIALGGAGSALSVNGALTNSGAIASTGTTTVGAGTALTAKAVTQNNLTVNGVLSIASKASGGGQSVTNHLSIAGSTNAWTGKLDLADNSLIVNYSGASPAATIANQIKEAFGATGHWDGSGGITSSSAASDPSHFSLGYADGADHVAAGLPAGQVLVQYTRAGDANLDGIVNVVDLGILATHYGHTGTWDQGDYNYDGLINVVDLGILATNYGHGTSLTASQAAVQFQEDLTQFPQFQPVPEPASIGLSAAIGAGLLLRRRTSC